MQGRKRLLSTLLVFAAATVFAQTPVLEFEPQGATPGQAVVVHVPDKLWQPQGTLEFRLHASRTLRFSKAKPLSVRLVKCPLFTLTLTEGKRHLVLAADLAHDGSVTDRRALAAATRGRLYWSHLDAGKWYNVAVSWHAAKGRFDVFLNRAIQQEMRLRRRWQPWRPPTRLSGDLELGGSLGDGDALAKLAVDSVRLYPDFMDEPAVAATLAGRPNFPLTNEGRWDFKRGLDLAPYKLSLVYETDFDKPLNVIHEDALFDGDKRVRLSEGKDWVLEGMGGGKAWTERGRCIVQTNGKHQVLWNTRCFPADLLIEFGVSPKDSRIGLAIVFFATRGLDGGSPFALSQPKRAGVFKMYHSGALNGYHASYWATNPADGGILRRTTNLRKNAGFFMPAAGIDRIGGAGAGPHRVRILKVGGKIRIETRGRLALEFDDDGQTYGPVWRDGWVGLRQMGHSQQVSYTYFKVWRVEPKPRP